MIEFVCEYAVKEDSRSQFELAYGPGGMWSKLFAKSPGYRGTTVLRDANDPQRYLTFDIWDSVAQQDQALEEGKAAYSDLVAAFEEWLESKTEIGTFSMLAQATVRPQTKTRKSKTRGKL
jgi:heme-degrading monooxygenase HmoA